MKRKMSGAFFAVQLLVMFGCNQHRTSEDIATVDASGQEAATKAGDGNLVGKGDDVLPAGVDGLTDPGMPATVYGPKFGGSMMMIGGNANYLGTATANARDGVAHFFGITPPNQRRPKDIYLSFAFPASEWKVGKVDLETPGIVGTYSFVDPATGERYSLNLSRPSPGADFRMEITSLVAASDPDSSSKGAVYLRGKLKARVPSVSKPDMAAIIDFTVN